MPIINLTDTPDGKGLPRIAKLHKGDKKLPNGQVGPDLDYFRVVFEPEFEQFREAWEDLFGKEPDHFDEVFMTHATVDKAFESWKEEWNTSQTLLHRCDGENQINWYNVPANMYMTAKTTCAMKTDTPCACKAVGRLNLIIPEFIGITGILGYVQVETHSINDILTVYSMLANIQRMNGTLLGVPFSLGRSGKQISVPMKGKRGKVTKSLFYLYVDTVFARETLLPRLTATGGFLAPDQPALPAPAPKLDTEEIKNRLGTGDGNRRMAEPEATKDIFDGVNPPAVEPVAPPPPVVATPQPQAEIQTVAGTVVGIDTVGNAIGQLKTRALKELFGGTNTKAMNKCISELMGAGKLPPIMSIDEALKIIKAANCPDAAPEVESDETVVQATMPGMPRVAEPI